MKSIGLKCSLLNKAAAAVIATVAGSAVLFSGASSANEKKLHIVALGWTVADPFFTSLVKGVEDAAKANPDATIEYAQPQEATIPSYLDRMELIIGQHPDAMAVATFFPEQQQPLIEKALQAGIRVVLMNSGLSLANQLHLPFAGADPEQDGKMAALRIKKAGVKHLLYINHCPGTESCVTRGVAIQQALKDSGIKVSVLNFSADEKDNPAAAVQAVRGTVSADATIDAIISFSAQLVPIQKALEEVGRTTIKIGMFGLSRPALDAVVAGSVEFLTDEQAYVEGYYGALMAYQQAKYQMGPVGTVLTGPLMIDTPKAAQAVIDSNLDGIRGYR